MEMKTNDLKFAVGHSIEKNNGNDNNNINIYNKEMVRFLN